MPNYLNVLKKLRSLFQWDESASSTIFVLMVRVTIWFKHQVGIAEDVLVKDVRKLQIANAGNVASVFVLDATIISEKSDTLSQPIHELVSNLMLCFCAFS